VTGALPKLYSVERVPFIRLEDEVEQLISGSGTKTAAFLQLLKETGARPREAWNLQWTDVDAQTRIAAQKDSKARQFKVSTSLLAMLNSLPHKSNYLFRNPDVYPLRSLDDFSRNFSEHRKRLAERLQNPRIQQISFRTLRHFKATHGRGYSIGRLIQ
jgi:integrase